MAALIVRLHDDARFNAACSQAAQAFVATDLSDARLDAALSGVMRPSPA